MINFKYLKLQISTVTILLGILCYVRGQDNATEFSPQVSAICKDGNMNIKILLSEPYNGVVHVRDYRTANCMVYGNGGTNLSYSLNLYAQQGRSDYCGITFTKREKERSIQLVVRAHRTLELADDKYFIITCGKRGFAREESTRAVLKFMENGKAVRETVYGREYQINVMTTNPDVMNGIGVRNCIAFDKKNMSVNLIDNQGFPVNSEIITEFVPAKDGKSAIANLKSMFKFPEGSQVHLQCEVYQCQNSCISNKTDPITSLKLTNIDENGNSTLATTTVYVIDPTELPLTTPVCEEGNIRPTWLLWLTIAFAILFVIMLLMNIFLCTAMSCSCARTEVIEKDPSIIEEYDPYRNWHESQYDSRYSLHGREGQNKGYMSGGSTIHSHKSEQY